MDQHQQHHAMPEDHPSMSAPTYNFYPTEHDPSSYNLAAFNGHMPYTVVQNTPPPRQLVTDLHPGMQSYPHIPLMPQFHHTNVYASSPPHGVMPPNSPPPPSPDMYDPLSPPVSGSDTSADGIYHHSNSSGINSPSSSRANSLVHRTSVRYNPTPSPTSSSGRRRSRSRDSDEEENMGLTSFNIENLANSRKEATRRQRIEAEQRRRDELRDGYAKLKDVLPVSNQKSSKVNLLERATNHIVALEKANQELKARINALEQEMTRLRAINEKISLANTELPPSMFDPRTLSPPPGAPVTPPADAGATAAAAQAKNQTQQSPSNHSSPAAKEEQEH